MQVEFTIELFDFVIEETIDIPDSEVKILPKEEQYDFIYQYIQNEINNTMQLYVDDATRDV